MRKRSIVSLFIRPLYAMPRFTIRDMCWIALAVAIALLWLRESGKQRERNEERLLLTSQFDAALHDQQITEGWHADAEPSEYEIGLDSHIRHGGASSAFIKAKVPAPKSYAALKQHFRADDYRGQRIHLSGFAKTDKVGCALLWMRFEGMPIGAANAAVPEFKVARAIPGKANWQRYEIVADIPAETTNIEFGVSSGGGQLWFDDLQLQIVGQESPTTASPSATADLMAALAGFSPPREPQVPEQKTTPRLQRRPLNLDFESPTHPPKPRNLDFEK